MGSRARCVSSHRASDSLTGLVIAISTRKPRPNRRVYALGAATGTRIGCAVVATSGLSYLQGVEKEDRTLADVSAKAGFPVLTSPALLRERRAADEF